MKEGGLYYRCECSGKTYCGNVCFYQDFGYEHFCPLRTISSNGKEVIEWCDKRCSICTKLVRQCHFSSMLTETEIFCSAECAVKFNRPVVLSGLPLKNPEDDAFEDAIDAMCENIVEDFEDDNQNKEQ